MGFEHSVTRFWVNWLTADDLTRENTSEIQESVSIIREVVNRILVHLNNLTLSIPSGDVLLPWTATLKTINRKVLTSLVHADVYAIDLFYRACAKSESKPTQLLQAKIR